MRLRDGWSVPLRWFWLPVGSLDQNHLGLLNGCRWAGKVTARPPRANPRTNGSRIFGVRNSLAHTTQLKKSEDALTSISPYATHIAAHA